ncbi:MAG: hypothetical protein MHM6MM_002494 [Cercozoa sp. M6MM]
MSSVSSKHCFTVERIIAHRKRRNGEVLYRVRWLGYSEQDDTWEPVSSFSDMRAIEAYMSTVAADPIDDSSSTSVSSNENRGGGIRGLPKLPRANVAVRRVVSDLELRRAIGCRPPSVDAPTPMRARTQKAKNARKIEANRVDMENLLAPEDARSFDTFSCRRCGVQSLVSTGTRYAQCGRCQEVQAVQPSTTAHCAQCCRLVTVPAEAARFACGVCGTLNEIKHNREDTPMAEWLHDDAFALFCHDALRLHEAYRTQRFIRRSRSLSSPSTVQSPRPVVPGVSSDAFKLTQRVQYVKQAKRLLQYQNLMNETHVLRCRDLWNKLPEQAREEVRQRVRLDAEAAQVLRQQLQQLAERQRRAQVGQYSTPPTPSS